jgi:hypothetical protein
MHERLLALVRAVLPVGFAWVVIFTAGCGKSEHGSLNPVTGEVFVNGQPAVNATVIFYPKQQDGEPPVKAYPGAVVGDDGSFKLTTWSKNDGAPEGEYVVTVVWSDTARVDGETIDGPDKLRGRYAYKFNSTLSATIKKGKNQLPRFELN